MPGLRDVERFRIGSDALDTTIDWLREVGETGNEGFVLWSGHHDGSTFTIRRALWPRQRPQQTEHGLLVYVPGDALAEVNAFCYEHDEIVGAQVHTHPTDAFHSDTDDHFPLVTLLGSLSVVIPNFARADRADATGWAYYRLVGPATWDKTDEHVLEVIE
jgi:hypothetical protein